MPEILKKTLHNNARVLLEHGIAQKAAATAGVTGDCMPKVLCSTNSESGKNYYFIGLDISPERTKLVLVGHIAKSVGSVSLFQDVFTKDELGLVARLAEDTRSICEDQDIAYSLETGRTV